jgi:CBS domain-containing protein
MVKTVRDVMMPEPWTVDARTSLEETAHLMRGWDMREVLVTDDDELCGVLTDSDIIVIAIASGRAPTTLTAGECANPHLQRLDADMPVVEGFEHMRRHALRRVPVVAGNHLVGTAWIADLASAAEQAHQPTRA